MKKFASILGAIVCLIVMEKPKSERPVRTVVNNYFIKGATESHSGCGGCGGNCKCGGHR